MHTPVAAGRSSLLSWPMREMAWKSAGLKVASFQASSAGPCQAAIVGAAGGRSVRRLPRHMPIWHHKGAEQGCTAHAELSCCQGLHAATCNP